jgi:beta-1,4-N-acetylglucosaminyltransferase
MISLDQKTAFVTVGTTSFDDLIMHLDCPEFAEIVSTKWMCTHCVLQIGRGTFEPSYLSSEEAEKRWSIKFRFVAKISPNRANCNPLTLPNFCNFLLDSWFRFAPNLNTYMRSAYIIISHCGAGSILEALELGKPLVVVVNASLMVLLLPT